jgi:hypothetical protein
MLITFVVIKEKNRYMSMDIIKDPDFKRWLSELKIRFTVPAGLCASYFHVSVIANEVKQSRI